MTILKRVSRRKLISIAVAVLLVVALATGLLLWLLPQPAYASVTTLSILSGKAFVLKAGTDTWVEASDGATIKPGYHVRTDPDSNALITFFEGSTVELEPDSYVIITELATVKETGSTIVRLKQQIGRTWNRVEKLIDPASRYEIETPAGVAVVRGTLLEIAVAANGDTLARTFEGIAMIIAQAKEVLVTAGTETTVEQGKPPAAPTVMPPPINTLRVSLHSAAWMLVVDPLGRSAGIVPPGIAVNQIPRTTVTKPGEEPQIIEIPDPKAGEYRIVLYDKAAGSFRLTVEGTTQGNTIFSQSIEGEAASGQKHQTRLTLEVTNGLPTGGSLSPMESLGKKESQPKVVVMEQAVEKVVTPTSTTPPPTPPPSITSLDPTAGIPGTAVTITGSSFGEAQGASMVNFGGARAAIISWSDTRIIVTVPRLPPGVAQVAVAAGGQSSSAVPFTVDQLPLTVTSLSPPSGPPDTQVTINGSYFEDEQGAGTVSFGGAPAAILSWSDTSIVASVPQLSPGVAQVVVAVFNLTSSPLSFVVTDITPPAISAIASSNITTAGATLAWSTSEPATSQIAYSTVSHTADTYASTAALLTAYGSSPPPHATLALSHSISLGGLSPNTTYYYRVISRDAWDNTAWSAEYSFITLPDTTPPAISAVASSGITLTSATIAWNTNEMATSQVAYSTTSHATEAFASIAALRTAYGSNSTEEPALAGSHTISLTGLTPNTPYYYRAISRDASSNYAWSVEYAFLTVADTTRPTISAVASSGITLTSATVTWSTDEPATSQVAYNTTSHAAEAFASVAALLTAYDSSTAKDVGLDTSQTAALTGLTPATTYYYRALSVDGAGNEKWSDEYSFTTAADITPPVISGVTSSGIASNEADINWDTDEPTRSRVAYSTTSQSAGPFANLAALLAAYGSSTAEDASLVVDHTVSLIGLSPNTTYYYRALSVDASGNEAWSAEHSFKTAPDVTAPKVSGVTVFGVTSSGVNIAWDTDEPATSQVAYSITSHATETYTSIAALLAVYGSKSAEDTAPVNSHAVTLTGLNPNTTYYYRVISRDASDNWACPLQHSFTTLADTTAPVITWVTSSGVTITWETDEPATSQVEYGTASATHGNYGPISPEDPILVGSHTVLLTGLNPNTTYYYRVISKDASGNMAWSADEYSFTTAADLTAPVISGVGSSGVTISWDTDEGATTQVAYSTTSHKDDPFASIAAVRNTYGSSSPSPEDSTLVFSHAVLLIGPSPNTTYYYRAISKDAWGNEAWSSEYSFATAADVTAPVISDIFVPDVTSTIAIIWWTTSEPATSQVEYDTTPATHSNYSSSSTEYTGLVSEQQVIIQGLTPNTTYYYRVISRDSWDNEAWSAECSFTTAAEVP